MLLFKGTPITELPKAPAGIAPSRSVQSGLPVHAGGWINYQGL
ncbi:MAG: hypothetical protein ABI760_02560 [Ferruginibacter sp.]